MNTNTINGTTETTGSFDERVKAAYETEQARVKAAEDEEKWAEEQRALAKTEPLRLALEAALPTDIRSHFDITYVENHGYHGGAVAKLRLEGHEYRIWHDARYDEFEDAQPWMLNSERSNSTQTTAALLPEKLILLVGERRAQDAEQKAAKKRAEARMRQEQESEQAKVESAYPRLLDDNGYTQTVILSESVTYGGTVILIAKLSGGDTIQLSRLDSNAYVPDEDNPQRAYPPFSLSDNELAALNKAHNDYQEHLAKKQKERAEDDSDIPF